MDESRIRLRCPRCRTVQEVDLKLAQMRQVYCPCGAWMGLPRPKPPGEEPPPDDTDPETEYEVLTDPEIVEEPTTDADGIPTAAPIDATLWADVSFAPRSHVPPGVPRLGPAPHPNPAVRPEPVFPLPSSSARVPSYWLVHVASRGLIGSGILSFCAGVVLIVAGLVGGGQDVKSALGVATGVPLVIYGVLGAVGGAALSLVRDVARRNFRVEAALRELRAELRRRGE